MQPCVFFLRNLIIAKIHHIENVHRDFICGHDPRYVGYPEHAEENVSHVLQQYGNGIVDEIQMVDRFLGPSDLGGYEKVKTETMEYCVERTVAYNIYVRG